MRAIKRRIIGIIGALVLALFGVSFAFFSYYKEGNNMKITAGQIFMVFKESGDSLKLPNAFPQTKEEARKRTDNIITFTVSGVNTNDKKDIYYEIMLNNGDPEEGMLRFKPSDIVFDLIELDEQGNEKLVVDAMSFDDFNEKRIWVNTIGHETNKSITRTYSLRMWLSEKVIVSDSIENANYSSDVFSKSYASIRIIVNGNFEKKQMN